MPGQTDANRLHKFTKKDSLLLQRAFRYVQPDKTRLIISFFLIITEILLGLLQPMLWAVILTGIFGKLYRKIVLYFIIITAVSIAEIFIHFIQNYNTAFLNENIVLNVKKDMYKKILDLPVKAFDDFRVGDFISRLQNDAGSIANMITGQLLNIAIDMLKVIILGITVFYLSLPLALIIIALFPVSVILFIKYGKVLRKQSRELAGLNDGYLSSMQQTLSGIREVKGLGIKKQKYHLFLSFASLIKDKLVKIGLLNGAAQGLTQGFNFLSLTGVMGVGVYLLYLGSLKMEYFISFNSYAHQFSQSLMNIIRFNVNMQQLLTSLERIFAIMDNLNYEQETSGNREFKQAAGDIRFENISFGYNRNSPVLTGISMDIRPNRRIAIVGKSGSGKTTLFNLLQRFYRPGAGKILLDGIDICEFSEHALRKHIAVVSQEPFLFNLSIKDNLLLANPGATYEEIAAACKHSYIHDFIAGLPLGYDTIIGENGINLSGGQKQRIAIARAFLKGSRIILFDEATSSLDNESQYNIKQALQHLSENHTVVVIAHRLLTVMEADEIFVLDNGRITGQGTHKLLMEKNAVYRQLYKEEWEYMQTQQRGVTRNYA